MTMMARMQNEWGKDDRRYPGVDTKHHVKSADCEENITDKERKIAHVAGHRVDVTSEAADGLTGRIWECPCPRAFKDGLDQVLA
jgi:hypothetical protein